MKTLSVLLGVVLGSFSQSPSRSAPAPLASYRRGGVCRVCAFALVALALLSGPFTVGLGQSAQLIHPPEASLGEGHLAASAMNSALVIGDGELIIWGARWLDLTEPIGGSVGGPRRVRVAPVRSVAFGQGHALVALEDGTLIVWGANAVGQLGTGDTNERREPTGVVLALPISAVAAGAFHSMVLTTDGSVYTWGRNDHGQLGREGGSSDPLPGRVPGLPAISQISAGADHALAVDQHGGLWVWGANDRGQLGTGGYLDDWKPQRLSLPTDVVAVAGGGAHTLAVMDDGTVLAWGANDRGQLGVGDTEDRNAPVPVELRPFGMPTAAAAGYEYSLILGSSGEVWAWGANGLGQLGLSRSKAAGEQQVLGPTLIPGISPIRSLAAGFGHVIALDTSGNLWGWGSNRFQQLTWTEKVSIEPTIIWGGM